MVEGGGRRERGEGEGRKEEKVGGERGGERRERDTH